LIGAVNTIVVRDDRLVGHNTDTTGFTRAIAPLVAASSHGRVALIGAGGVGKAIAFALADLGVEQLRLFDREPAKAQQLAARLEGRIKTSVTSGIEEALRDAVGVVNGSLVGMLPNLGTPVPDALLHAGLRVADAVYSPLWTPKAKGATAALRGHRHAGSPRGTPGETPAFNGEGLSGASARIRGRCRRSPR